MEQPHKRPVMEKAFLRDVYTCTPLVKSSCTISKTYFWPCENFSAMSKNANLKHGYFVINHGKIENIVMQYWLPKQGKVGHPKILFCELHVNVDTLWREHHCPGQPRSWFEKCQPIMETYRITYVLHIFTNFIMYLFQIPLCVIQNRNMYISVLNGALLDMEPVHSGICEIGLLTLPYEA